MRITASMPRLELNEEKFEKHVQQQLYAVWIDAIHAFVEAASARVPHVSGQARGTFKKIQKRIGGQLSSGPLPAPTSRVNKGQSATRGMAMTDLSLISKKGPEFIFELDNEGIPYFNKWENVDSYNGPWKSFEAGSEALEETLENGINELDLDITPFIEVT